MLTPFFFSVNRPCLYNFMFASNAFAVFASLRHIVISLSRLPHPESSLAPCGTTDTVVATLRRILVA
jgi:hypothetical protein